MKLLYTIFTLAIKQNLLGLLNSEILFPENMPQIAFFGFPDNKKILKSLTIYILYFLRKIEEKYNWNLQHWETNIFTQKRRAKFKKMAYTRKPIKTNEI